MVQILRLRNTPILSFWRIAILTGQRMRTGILTTANDQRSFHYYEAGLLRLRQSVKISIADATVSNFAAPLGPMVHFSDCHM